MVSENLIDDLKFSSVVPARITGEDKQHEFTGMNLATKLHHITTVHFFDKSAAEGLTIHDFKKPMFEWLNFYYPICGRIRRRDGGSAATGRPYVRCNDSGVRIVEARCGGKTVDEWLQESTDGGGGDRSHRWLVYRQALIGGDLGFTPLVFLQLTRFKCGGLCVGMSWAHILGDAFSALECINMWGKIMANQTTLPPHYFLKTPSTSDHHFDKTSSFNCRSVKQLEPLGDNWLTPNNCKMQMHTFHVADTKHLMSKLLGLKDHKLGPFEVISAIIWKSLAKIREISNNNNSEPNIVTIWGEKDENQVIGIVKGENVIDEDPLELAKKIGEKLVDETSMIEKLMEKENGNLDFIVYGANLTFVNLERVDLYGLQVKGHGPVFADLSIGGVGDEGAVIVLPFDGENGCGRIVNVILPQDQLEDLKNELRVEWGIF